LGVALGLGPEAATLFEPPNSSGINLSTVYFERSVFETLYNAKAIRFVALNNLWTDFV
jgi:hypothetical protein